MVGKDMGWKIGAYTVLDLLETAERGEQLDLRAALAPAREIDVRARF